MSREAECPYCGEWFDIDYIECDDFEHECPHCEEVMDVHVDYDPDFSTSKISYSNCSECDHEIKNIQDYNNTVPKPNKYNASDEYHLCQSCYYKLVLEDMRNQETN